MALTKLAVVATLAMSFGATVSADGSGKKSVERILNARSVWQPCEAKHEQGRTSIGRCRDGTLSYDQPESLRAVPGGICGPTAVANVFANMCGNLDINPLAVDLAIPRAAGATNMSQLQELLNERNIEPEGCRGMRWEKTAVSQIDFVQNDVDSLRWAVTTWPRQTASYLWRIDSSGRKGKRLPVLVRLRNPETPDAPGHVTMVVDVESNTTGCWVVHNTWRRQYWTHCTAFKSLSDGGIYLARTKEQERT